jgi:hypothetical protein
VKVSTLPGIVAREPLGSLDLVREMLVTEKLSETELEPVPIAELEESVSTEPGIVVREPFGSVEVIGAIVVTDGL